MRTRRSRERRRVAAAAADEWAIESKRASARGSFESRVVHGIVGSSRLELSDASRSGEPLTEVGMMLGTVGYLPPEQLLGNPIDARADVFAFCVTMWRALAGKMPFPTHDIEQYLEAIASPPTRPQSGPMPAWIYEVLVRGMMAEPSARIGSMDELLAALDADPSRRHRAYYASAAVVGAIALAVAGAGRHRANIVSACRAEGNSVFVTWNTGKRAETKAAMLADGDPFAADRAARALAAVDTYVEEWRAAQTASCEATRVKKTQEEAVHERRSGCMENHKLKLLNHRA